MLKFPLRPFSTSQQADPPAASQWQQQWEAQVRQVAEAQQALRSEGVGLHTAEVLAGAERAAGQLEEKLAGLKEVDTGEGK